MEKEFVIELTQDQVDYLQRLGAEVDGKVFLIDRMFANHATDTDTMLFDSVPFKHYTKEYENAYAAWELAKKEIETSQIKPEVQRITGREDVQFSWLIDDYTSLECKITLV